MSIPTAFFGFWLLVASALANELEAKPTYLGPRSNNPEQETYATPADGTAFARMTLAFVGPARSVGPITGDPEKDTVAFSPRFVEPAECRPHSAQTTHVEVQ